MFSVRFLPHFLLFLGFLYGMLNGVAALWSEVLEIPFRRRDPLRGRPARIAAWFLIAFSAWCLLGFVSLVRYTLDPDGSWFFIELLRNIGMIS